MMGATIRLQCFFNYSPDPPCPNKAEATNAGKAGRKRRIRNRLILIKPILFPLQTLLCFYTTLSE
jgi:hypothetical protein